MPRIYASNNDPYDYCLRCFPGENSEDAAELGNKGEGPDGRGNCYGYDAGHPDYEDDEYNCANCGRRLTNEDNDMVHPDRVWERG
jgi:hypothetical protein